VSFPFDIQSAAVFDSHIPCRSPAMPRPCRSESDLSRPRHSVAWEQHGMCELASAVQRRYLGDLPAFGFFRLPSGVPRRLLQEADYQLGYIRPPRGLSRRTRHCRRMAGSRHGMCELTRQGSGMGTVWYV
jgi:hypothetical protein